MAMEEAVWIKYVPKALHTKTRHVLAQALSVVVPNGESRTVTLEATRGEAMLLLAVGITT